MRLSYAALVLAGILAAAPAIAQDERSGNQNDRSGVGGVIRNLDNAINHNDRDARDRDYSGSSVPPRSYEDSHERQLNERQRQLDDQHDRLNERQRELDSHRDYERHDRDRDDSR